MLFRSLKMLISAKSICALCCFNCYWCVVCVLTPQIFCDRMTSNSSFRLNVTSASYRAEREVTHSAFSFFGISSMFAKLSRLKTLPQTLVSCVIARRCLF